MKDQHRKLLTHLLLVLLQTIGLTLPICAMFGLSGFIPYGIVTIAIILPLLELSRLNRFTFRALPVLLLIIAALFIFLGRGSTLLSDLYLGCSLYFQDVPASLVLFSKEMVLVISLFITVIVFYISIPDVGALLLLSFTVLVFGFLCYSNHSDLLWSFSPAIVATTIFLIKLSRPEISELRLFIPITALVIVAMLVTPFSGIISEPLKDAANELRQAVTDQFFFTDARNVFSLADEGFYPEGLSQLGGKAEISDTPVMEVSSREKLYLRGVTYDRYTGRNWIQSTGGRRYPWFSRSWKQLRTETFCMDRPFSDTVTRYFDPVSFSIRILNEKASTLFVPQAIRELRPGGNLVPYFNASSEVFITRNLQPGDTYSGTAYSFNSGDPGLGTLLEACGTVNDPNYAQIKSCYTVLPTHLESAIYDLAAKVTKGCVTPYEKAFAIQNWLSRNYTYTLDVEDQPPDLDFVTNFLLNNKKGYCMYFASAMTVLSRIVGLPARFVEGYLFVPEKNGNAILTGHDAHAWSEIYFSGFGWVTFDATPVSDNHRERSDPEPKATPTPTPTPEPEPTPEANNNAPTPSPEKDEPTSSPENDFPTPIAQDDPNTPIPPEESEEPPISTPNEPNNLLSVLPWILLLLLVLAIIITRIIVTDPHFLVSRASNDMERLRISAQSLYDLLHISGLDVHKGETPMSFMKRCDRSGLATTSVAKAGACISIICYAHLMPESEDIHLVRNVADAYFRNLSFPAKLHYILYRSFVPMHSRRFDSQTFPISETEEYHNVENRPFKACSRFRNHTGADPEPKPSERL